MVNNYITRLGWREKELQAIIYPPIFDPEVLEDLEIC